MKTLEYKDTDSVLIIHEDGSLEGFIAGDSEDEDRLVDESSAEWKAWLCLYMLANDEAIKLVSNLMKGTIVSLEEDK